MKRTISLCAIALSLGAGCEAFGIGDDEDDDGGEEEEQLECDSSDGADATFCDDFNDGDDDAWSPEGGNWEVTDGRYVGHGPSEIPGECGASLMIASYREDSEATDLTIHAEIGSIAWVDRTIVMRATDASNRIEINFRGDPVNDVVVQELVDCELVFRTQPGEIEAEQPADEAIEVDVELEGQHLRVSVDGELVIDRDFDFANMGEGQTGVAVINNAITTFDNVWITPQ